MSETSYPDRLAAAGGHPLTPGVRDARDGMRKFAETHFAENYWAQKVGGEWWVFGPNGNKSAGPFKDEREAKEAAENADKGYKKTAAR